MVFNAERLRQARRRRGLTRRRLAQVTGISERTLAYNESGKRAPSAEQRLALADALGFPDRFFLRDGPERVMKDGVSFRAMSCMRARDRERALASAELALELSVWLDQKFKLPDPDLPDCRHHRNPEAAAVALRSHWCLGDRPIGNLVHLLEKRGVRVFSVAEDSGTVDAFSFWNGERPYIFLNTLKSGERGRFDAAHELGHLVMHQHGQPRGRQAEQEADSFSSCFLMPRSSVAAKRPPVRNLDSLVRAKKRWGVSVLALARRWHDLGMLTDWHYRQVCINAQKRGYRRTEPDAIDRETSQVLRKALAHFWSQRVAPAQIAASFDWPTEELANLTFQQCAPSASSPSTTHRNGLRLVGGGDHPPTPPSGQSPAAQALRR